MAGTRYRRLVSFMLVALLAALFFSAGCQRKVVSEKSYSPAQFPEFSHLPRDDGRNRQQNNEPGFFEKTGRGIGNGFKKLLSAIGKLNPLD